MIFGDFIRALGQMGDPRFRRVLLMGIGLTIALLFGVYAAFLGLINWISPDTVHIPMLGEVTWVDDLLSFASIMLMIVMSMFLMIPVASVFTSLFLDDVAQAVEDRHYPHLPSVQRIPFGQGLVDSINFLGLLIGANLVAFVLYALLPLTAPVLFWGLNGFLLGREYFILVAMRRLGRIKAKAAWRKHIAPVWLAGALMAIPLSIPLLNLIIPILGAATFTHLFHRLERHSAR